MSICQEGALAYGQTRAKMIHIPRRCDAEAWHREVGRELAEAREDAGFSVQEVANRFS